FEEQVEKTPENIAVVFKEQSLTYRELNKKVNQLAKVLRNKGICPDQVVGIMLDRSLEMIIGVLAIVKAGGAYLPIDPEYPQSRIEYMLKDSQIEFLVSHRDLTDNLDFTGEIIDVDDKNLYKGDASNLERVHTSNNLAYVIYTSGTTGKPKGNLTMQYNVVRVVKNTNYIDIKKEDKILQLSNYAFDGSVFDIYGALLNGATLVLIKKDALLELSQLTKVIKEKEISVLFITTALFNALVDLNITCFENVRKVLFGGERISVKHAKKALEYMGKDKLIHVYGPTESTVYATYYYINEIAPKVDNIPIGSPLANTEIYILDKNNNLSPIGVGGELCISGDGLAKGYLNRPELTAEKFTQNPFAPTERMYRTGDLARWLPDGNIEFLGRIDEQVKIRGFRIELGEIENQLQSIENIKDAKVIVRNDSLGNKYLCAYYVLNKEMTTSDIKEELSRVLPEYMVPTHLVCLEEMPLTPNGKVDTKALPEPDLNARKAEYVAPTSEKEKILADIWSQVLGVERVSIKDSFFELGGDSIKAIQIIARANQQKLKLTVKEIFKHKTIENMVNNVDLEVSNAIISQKEVEGHVLLTPAQKWFFDQNLKRKDHWNMVNIFNLNHDADFELLEKVLQKVINHHDALRIAYDFEEDQIIQDNRKALDVTFKLQYEDISGYAYEQQVEKILGISEKIQSFDITKDLLFRAVVIDLGENDQRLLIAVHHLVMDGISWRILLEDIELLYHSNLNKELPLKTTSFREWSEKLAEYAVNKEIDVDYWKAIDLSKVETFYELDVKENYLEDHKVLQFELNQEQTQQLLTKAHWSYNTVMNDILLSSLLPALSEPLGTKSILLNLEGHGREEILEDIDLSRTISWFTSIYPVYLVKQATVDQTIKYVKESLRMIPEKGINYGIARYLQDDEYLQQINPVISFNYLGQFDIGFGQVQEESTNDEQNLLYNCNELPGEAFHKQNSHQYLIDIYGVVSNGKLQMNIKYNQKYFSDKTMEEIKNLYQHNLIETVDHCLGQEQRIYTVSDFGLENVISKENFERISEVIDVANSDIYPLTPIQEGLLFHNIYDEDSNNYYYEQLCYCFKGKIDVEQLKKAWQIMINRYDVLKAQFFFKDIDRPIQVFAEEINAKIEDFDISNLDKEDQEAFVERFKKQDLQNKFDLSQESPNRLTIIKLSDTKLLLCWTFHHILLDGWSCQTILQDFVKIYTCLVKNLPFPKKSVQFNSYLEWLKNKDKEKGKQFWKKYLQDLVQPTLLPDIMKKDDKSVITEQKKFNIEFNKEKTSQLVEFCKSYNITLNALIQTAWGVLLQKYNNTNQSCFGMTVSGRPIDLDKVEEIVGIFINTIPVVVTTDNKDSFIDLLTRVNDNLIEIRDYEYISLAEIQSLSNHAELFDSFIAYENYPVKESNSEFEMELDSIFEMTNYDMSISVLQSSENVVINMQSNSKRFPTLLIESIIENFRNLILYILQSPEDSVEKYSIVSAKEKERLLHEFNDTAMDYPKDKTLSELFEEEVNKNPEQLAIIFGEEKRSYQELNHRSNQLARYLRDKGVGPDTIVGMMLNRSTEMMIGIMGILKAGGAYLPIDPEYPRTRIEYMLRDSQIEFLVSHRNLADNIDFTGEIIDVDAKNIYKGDYSNLEKIHTANNLAYVIYTSGTTGKPKGNLTIQYNVVRVVKNTNYIDIKKEDKILQLSNYAFDGSVFDIYGALLNGATLVLIKKDALLELSQLTKIIKEKEISVLFITTALFNALLDLNITCFENVRKVLFGGERISVKHAKKALEYMGKDKIIHVYGPTESTVYATYYFINGIDSKVDNVPIGSPLANTEIYILDKNNKLSPIGVGGELCISGDGLARGYLNRPELTAKKFIQNPFVLRERMYRTGDLARWLPDGNIEFLSRIDNQVKIRGFRIELGEIENQLMDYEGIKEASVIDLVDETGSKYLCGYIVTEKEISISAIKDYLAKKLPIYMVPAYFIELNKMPLTPHGKIDRKALPIPDGVNTSLEEYVAPSNEIEEKMVLIWSKILGVKKVGVTDDFFALGGHSLKGIQLVANIAKEFNVEVPLKEIFESPTIRGIVELIGSLDESTYNSIKPVKESEYYHVSSAQKRIYALRQLEDEDSTAYNIPFIMEIEGELDIERFEKALKALIDRHESLRTYFDVVDGKAVQRILPEVDFKLKVSKVDEAEINERIKQFIQSFDLAKAPLMRVEIVQSNKKQLLMLDVHHIISDGVSMNIFFNDLTALYDGRELSELEVQYKDFSAWQNQLLTSSLMKEQESYWLDRFSGEIPVLNMPTDYPRPVEMTFAGDYYKHELSSELMKKLTEFTSRNNVTLYMLLLAAYNILLSRYSGQEDIIIGSPIAGRDHADLENVLGMFVNTLAMRNYPTKDKTFADFLKEVKDNSLDAFENQQFQIEMLIDKLNLTRDLSRNPLFDVTFIVQNANQLDFATDNLKFRFYDFDYNIAKFDLTLAVYENGLDEEMNFYFEYNTGLYKKETITRLAIHLERIIWTVLANPELALSEIEFITEEEKQQLLVDFNQTYAEYSAEKTIHQLFMEQVIRVPDNIAVVFGEEKLTYQMLDDRANLLAAKLRAAGIKANEIVAIMVERSVEMIIGYLGVLKAGGAYLPIDPEYPKARIEYMLQDSNAKLLLTEDKLMNSVEFSGQMIDLKDPNLYLGEVKFLDNINNCRDLAYLIYTSGTTGLPKGVMIEHRGIVNLQKFFVSYLGILETDRVLQFATCAFDAAVLDCYMALLTGASLHLVLTDVIKDYRKFEDFLNEQGITIVLLPPIYLSNLNPANVQTLRKLLTGGSATNFDLIEKWNNSNREYINAYGPTETTICATAWKAEGGDYHTVPIGQPITNTRAYILDEQMNLVPIGIAGELCISTVGLARGYLNRPELTKEKFVDTLTFGRLYKTGDLARWLPDGNIEFLGRIDHQVKIRGFRIELAEIENHLLQHEEIIEVIVIDREDKNGNKYLVAYLVSCRKLAHAELIEYLQVYLPEYMIPAYFIHLPEMPLTSSGKIDRKALPAPELSSSNTYMAPTTEKEEVLAAIWADVLGAEPVGVEDNFFELGGDSIKAIQILTRARQHKINLTVKELFRHRTISALLKNVDYSGEGLNISQADVEGEVFLTPIQEWFFAQNLVKREYWNQTNLFKLPDDVDLELLERVFVKIISHHDALRMGYKFNNGVAQFNRRMDQIKFKLELIDLSQDLSDIKKSKILQISEEIQNELILEEDLLLKATVFDLGNEKILMLMIHHLVVDGVSWRILVEDIEQLYVSNLEIKLPLKTTSFKEWSACLVEYAKEELNLKYWYNIDQTKLLFLANPLDNERYLRDHKKLTLELSSKETELLLTTANWVFGTNVNDILLTALTLAVSEGLQFDHFLVNLEGHGREEIIDQVDISRTVGWFTSAFPVYFANQSTLEKTLTHVKESLRRVPNKGINYGIGRFLQKDQKLQLLNPEISFNYLGQFTDSAKNFLKRSDLEVKSIHPDNRHNFIIDINCLVINGLLKMSLSYNERFVDAQLMEKLKTTYLQKLQELIELCVKQTKKIYTPSDFGVENTLSETDLETIGQTVNLEKVKIYPLTSMQEGMLYHTIITEEGNAYYEQFCFYLNGQVDVAKFNRAWQEVVNRHEILRTKFVWQKVKNPVQIVLPEIEAEFSFHNIADMDAPEQAQYLENFKKEDLANRFDFNSDRLNRLTLLKLSPEKYLICWSLHHILLDGWSLPIVLGDLFKAYQALVNDTPLLPEPVAQFGSYLDWLKTRPVKKAETFWKQYLQDFTEPTLLPFVNKKQPKADIVEVGVKECTFAEDITQKINEFCKKYSITSNALIQAAWGLLLQKYNNTDLSCYGMTVSGRPAELKNVENIAGIFMNTLPIIIKSVEKQTIQDLLTKINMELVELRDFEYFSLAQIQKYTAHVDKLFDSIVVFENYPISRTASGQDMDFTVEIDSIFEMTNYDLTVSVGNSDNFFIRYTYNKASLNVEAVETISKHLSRLLDLMITEPTKELSRISIITDEERELILGQFNQTTVDYPKEKTIHRLFEEQVLKTPDNLALVYNDQKFTYKELNEKANQLARLLRARGVGPDNIVGLLLDRSPEMIIGILAIIKAGGAYLPIDINYPEDRIHFMLEDSKTRLLLTQKDMVDRIKYSGEIIDITTSELYIGESTNLEDVNKATDLIYIMYTSGSTGKAKGVMIEHQNVNRLISNSNVLIINETDRILQTGSLAFDASTFEIWGAFLNGGGLYLAHKDDMFSADGFEKKLREYQINIIWLTSPFFNQLLDENINIFAGLRMLLVGGDVLSPRHINRVREAYKDLTVVNGYGPTESTTFTTTYIIDREFQESIPIGKPISNTQVYIVDKYNNLQPLGIPGELCISGDGLARGYLNRLELTAEKFVENPFKLGTRMYRTGDLVKWLPDGNIEFIERIDFQVKIRGYRIELDEIENHLLAIKGIKECIVLARVDKKGSKYLCAYIVLNDKDLTVSDIREKLAKSLPDHMIPAYFILLDKMPLTSNGKVDRRVLPEPEGNFNTGIEYVEPENETERRIAKIWTEIVGIEKIGINDKFFEVGGDSLKIIRLTNLINKEFGTDLNVTDLFKYNTIKLLADKFTENQKPVEKKKPKVFTFS
ncbi:MAG: amino acid adenylation domain-containing protein, partial [Halanaerobiales bacterium]|nr:amino acid adenylation domain-containing protein [Halanaerobiales bacterium]